MAEVSFGEWLKRRRKSMGWTQEQLAQQINCSTSALRKMEAEERRPSEQIVKQLADTFNIASKEWASFLKFARGNWKATPTGIIEDAPWRASSPSPRSNLPTPLTSFIGREKEQAEILELINRHRLVTLVGAGGVGKTRLSLKIGEQVLEDYVYGVWLIELAPILDPLLAPRITAIAIGLRDEPQRPVIDMISDYLREKKMLIILDNCEHLLDACAHLADTLLKNCPSLKILATSREALGILGEAVYHVPSLDLPDLQQLLEKFRDYESVRLFEERSQLAQMDFSLTIENISSVAKICNHLDGIPLAIELAAARVSMFSTEQIAARLQESFNLLTTGNRTALPRHQTLQAAIDWSYDLLSPAEQILFQRLSVFVNGWTLVAAESVCSDVNIQSEDVLGLLTQLFKKSLVNIEELQSVTRYSMLETIRQYADEKLVESGERDALRDRHLEYFLHLVETAEPHLRRAEQIKWLKQLDAEYDNLRGALAWAMDKSSAEPALRLTGALGTFWFMRTHWVEGAKWLDQALSKEWDENNQAEKAARARALYRRADLANALDEMELEKTFAESALALCTQVEDKWGIAYSRAVVALHLWRTGDPKAGRLLAEQSLNEFHSLGDAWGESMVSLWLAGAFMMLRMQKEYFESRQRALVCARLSGDRDLIAKSLLGSASDFVSEGIWDQAEKMLQEAEQLFKEIGLSYEIISTQFLRAQILLGRGNPKQSKVEAQRCFEYFLRAGEKWMQAKLLLLLGSIAEIENDLPSAVEYVQKSVQLLKEIAAPEYIWWNLALGRLKYQQGDLEVAKQSVRDSLQLVSRRDIGVLGTAYIFYHLGGLFVEKKTHVAVHFLALAGALRQKLHFFRDPTFDKPYSERFPSTARAKLSEDEFNTAWEAGLNMTADEALDLALKTVEEM